MKGPSDAQPDLAAVPHASRRAFIAASSAAALGGWLTAAFPAILATAQAAQVARNEAGKFQVLAEEDARDLEAIAEQILPTTETPGAREAGVIWFIDQALHGTWGSWAAPILEDLRKFNAAAEPTGRFAELSAAEQAARLESIENTPLFERVHFLTLVGMFSMPGHGGNQDRLGWRLLGFEARHAWQPPFGHYDADPDGALQP